MSYAPFLAPTVGHVRAHPRYKVTIPLDCTIRDGFVSGHASNISRGGLFMPSERPLPVDVQVSLVLRFPATGLCIRATGRVVWSCGIEDRYRPTVPGSGIRFETMEPEDRKDLDAYLEHVARTATNRVGRLPDDGPTG